MTNAPERIWADANRQWSSVGWSRSNEFVGDVEYVRADIVQALTAESDRLKALVVSQGAQMQRQSEAAEAERDRLREALEVCVASIEHADMSDGVCCCGEEIEGHSDPMHSGHTPVDMGEYHASLAIKNARAVLKGETP